MILERNKNTVSKSVHSVVSVIIPSHPFPRRFESRGNSCLQETTVTMKYHITIYQDQKDYREHYFALTKIYTGILNCPGSLKLISNHPHVYMYIS